MSHFTPAFWPGRRVLVTTPTPAADDLVADLLDRGAAVVLLLGRGDTPGPFAGRVTVVRGRPDDLGRLTTALVLHDVRTVFHLSAFGLAAVRQAARLAGGVPVVVAPAGGTDLSADLLWRAEALAAPVARRAA